MNLVSQHITKMKFSLELVTKKPFLEMILEGLLDHFFSRERAHYQDNNVIWFLELINSLPLHKKNVSLRCYIHCNKNTKF